jgi:hypothetical protein
VTQRFSKDDWDALTLLPGMVFCAVVSSDGRLSDSEAASFAAAAADASAVDNELHRAMLVDFDRDFAPNVTRAMRLVREGDAAFRSCRRILEPALTDAEYREVTRSLLDAAKHLRDVDGSHPAEDARVRRIADIFGVSVGL